ncbi:DUF6580 family putative transport protein [Pseudopedobacter sp.]|uniref:DUF6580 family putative transport protein n=1 Tax=Pseudopedobacter sp. TaxID=1936787 RepID=UPI00334214D1
MSLNRKFILTLIILIAVSFRFLDLGENYSWANFTPVGAIALFAGTYFKDKVKSFFVPLCILFLSDILLGYKYTGTFSPYYPGIELVYVGFAAMVYIGSLVKKVNIVNVLLASVAAVFAHWILTDIQPWLAGPYTKDFSGYLQALIAAIPFEKNLLYGNIIFSMLMYGGYEFYKAKTHSLEESIA